MTASPLRIVVADLVRRRGSSRPVAVDAAVDGLDNGSVSVLAPVHVDVVLEQVPDGLVVRGEIDAHWEAPCSRCLRPVDGDLAVRVAELYEREPLEGETYLLEGDVLDLEPLVRDVLVLDLPSAPLCTAECLGLCPQCGRDQNQDPCECSTDEPDPRWDALRSLEIH